MAAPATGVPATNFSAELTGTITFPNTAGTYTITALATPAGGSASTVYYGYTGSGSGPTYTMHDPHGSPTAYYVDEQTVPVPGGVSISIQSTGLLWSYPDLHGDVAVTTSYSTRTGVLALYDPFGQPIDPATHRVGTLAAATTTPTTPSTETTSAGTRVATRSRSVPADGVTPRT